MSRPLLHISRAALHCDCALAGSSKRPFSTAKLGLVVRAAPSLPHAGVTCTASRPHQRHFGSWLGLRRHAQHDPPPWHDHWRSPHSPSHSSPQASTSREPHRPANQSQRTQNYCANCNCYLKLQQQPLEPPEGAPLFSARRRDEQHRGWTFGSEFNWGPHSRQQHQQQFNPWAHRAQFDSWWSPYSWLSGSHHHWLRRWHRHWHWHWYWRQAWNHEALRDSHQSWHAKVAAHHARASAAHQARWSAARQARSSPFTKWHSQWHDQARRCAEGIGISARAWGWQHVAGALPRLGMRLFATAPFTRPGFSPFGRQFPQGCPRSGIGPKMPGTIARRPYSQGSGCAPDSSLMLWIYLSRLVKGCLGSPTTSGPDVMTELNIHNRQFTTVQVRVQRTGSNRATLTISTRMQPIRQPAITELGPSPTYRRWFHATCRCEAPPLFLWFAALLKSSSVLNLIHTVTRVTMTLVPFTLVKMKIMSGMATKMPEDAPKRADFLHKVQAHRKLLFALFIVPFSLFCSALLACLERTPLTGRWRVILMSPQEEDDVTQQLQGTGWYNAVADILLSNSNGSMPKVIPVTDWRYQWVDQTLRKLESYLPVFRDEMAYHKTWFEAAAPDFPVPPPSRFPLIPRPRVSQLLHCFLSESSIDALTGHTDSADAPHVIMGPPYNLLLVEKPEVSNGFSYGFGGNGAAGIVVFSGFLDEILKIGEPAKPAPVPAPESSKSSWNSVFGGLGAAAAPAKPAHPVPTPEQTAQLAVLLAHEISHLMLAHHLETLSSSTILAPGVLGILSDILRTIFFPVTMLLGPFVNDAVANMTSVSRQEIIRGHESCFNRKLEIEADIVSARILAYAGFDPRIAVDFWESRLAPEQPAAQQTGRPRSSAHFWRGGQKGDTHPMREERIVRLKAELARWEAERQKSRAALAASRSTKTKTKT